MTTISHRFVRSTEVSTEILKSTLNFVYFRETELCRKTVQPVLVLYLSIMRKAARFKGHSRGLEIDVMYTVNANGSRNSLISDFVDLKQ